MFPRPAQSGAAAWPAARDANLPTLCFHGARSLQPRPPLRGARVRGPALGCLRSRASDAAFRPPFALRTGAISATCMGAAARTVKNAGGAQLSSAFGVRPRHRPAVSRRRSLRQSDDDDCSLRPLMPTSDTRAGEHDPYADIRVRRVRFVPVTPLEARAFADGEQPLHRRPRSLSRYVPSGNSTFRSPLRRRTRIFSWSTRNCFRRTRSAFMRSLSLHARWGRRRQRGASVLGLPNGSVFNSRLGPRTSAQRPFFLLALRSSANPAWRFFTSLRTRPIQSL